MTPGEVIHRLMHLALARIIAIGEQGGNDVLSKLADLLKQIPLELEQAARGRRSYADVLASLEHAAQDKGLERWLERGLRDYREHEIAHVQPTGPTIGEPSIREEQERKKLHHFLYLAFLDMRLSAYETQNEEAFCLADVFHNVPVQLEGVPQRGRTYDEILTSLRDRSRLRGCEAWLDQALRSVPADFTT